jgi:MFS family permease
MHGSTVDAIKEPGTIVPAPDLPWYKSLTGYQWFVFIVCCLAWDMDCMDQQLFNIARPSAMAELAPLSMPNADTATAAERGTVISNAASMATSIFLVGWAIGGIGFGVMGDRLGRVKTLMVTILLYAIFTGLSALSHTTTDFYLYRFLTGLGVGGVFAAAVTLLAETAPEKSRTIMLGLFQASSALGNCAAAGLSILFGWGVYQGWFGDHKIMGFTVTPWRLMFVVGIIPGLLVVLIQFWLKEPEKWLMSRNQPGKKGGSYAELLGDERYRSKAIFGLLLALAGVIGLWGIGFFSFDLQRNVMKARYETAATDLGLTGAAAASYIQWQGSLWSGITSLLQNLGAFFGIFVFSYASIFAGRKPTFAFFFVAAGLMTAAVFWYLDSWSDIFWMIPAMGFLQLALFGGYAIYFPELFPTRLRSTGTSFCYNVGRLVSATGPLLLGRITAYYYAQGLPEPMPSRYAGVWMCLVFGLGLIALPFLPETKGKPLPE